MGEKHSSPAHLTADQVESDPGRNLLTGLTRALLAGLGALLLAVPVVYVFLDRWLKAAIIDRYRSAWCTSTFLCDTYLPSYFIFILPAALLFFGLFFWKANRRPAAYGSGTLVVRPAMPAANPFLRQRRAANYLLEFAVGLGLVSVLVAGFTKQIPNLEIVAAVCVALFSRALYSYPWRELLRRSRTAFIAAAPLVIGQGVVLLFFRALAVDAQLIPLSGGLLAAVLFGLARWRKPGPVYWISLLFLALMLTEVNSWRFSTIGDEYSFFMYAQERFTSEGMQYMLNHITSGTGVYNSHPVFSSFLQVVSMALFGQDGYGWRVSSIYLGSVSLFFFYKFFKEFLRERIALLAIFFLGVSQYLISFSKIGYNNPQAFFALGLVLWAAAAAIRGRTAWGYAGLGAALGLCFYVYPAAFYAIPLPLLLLCLYDRPKKRADWLNWLNALVLLILMLLPLAFQPEYWAEKLPGTFLQNSDLNVFNTAAVLKNIATNLLYAFFSFVYIPLETHYVVVAYIDPVSALFLPIGLAWTLTQAKRNRFARFMGLTYFFMLFMVGASSGRDAPPNTRMFMLLPWFTLFSALGVDWTARAGSDLVRLFQKSRGELHRPPRLAWVYAGLAALVALTNVYMAFSLEQRRMADSASLEVLFLRLLARNQAAADRDELAYLFITDDSWGIEGIQLFPQVYHLPQARFQLQRVVVKRAVLPQEYRTLALDPQTIVVVQPTLQSKLQEAVLLYVERLGKSVCAIKATPTSDVRFYILLDPGRMELCPVDGHWQRQ